jgi:tape measure domain-containing protein
MSKEERVKLTLSAKDEASKVLSSISNEVKKVNKNLAKTSNVSNASSTATKGLTGSILKANLAFEGIRMATTAAYTGIKTVATSAVNLGSTMIKTAANTEQQRIAFKTLLGSVDAADDAISKIREDAKKTPFEMPGLIDMNKRLIAANVSLDDSRSLINDLGDAVSATGGSNAALNRMVANFQQIKSVGKASLRDIKQFGAAGIPIFDMLKDTTGKSKDEISEMISEGKIGFKELTKAFGDAAGAGGMFEDAMAEQSKTFSGMVGNIKDTVGIALGEIAEKSGLFDLVKDKTEGLLDFTEKASNVISGFFSFMKTGDIGGDFIESLNVHEDSRLVYWLLKARDAIKSFAKGARKFIGKLDLKKKLEAVFDFLKGAADDKGFEDSPVINLFKKLWDWGKKVWKVIKTFVEGFKEGFGPVIDEIKTALGGLFEAMGDDTENITEGFNNAIEAVKKWAPIIGKVVGKIIVWIIKIVTWMIKAGIKIRNTWRTVRDFIKNVWEAITGFVKGAIKKIKEWWNKFKTFITDLWNAIKIIFNDAVDKIKKKWKRFRDIVVALWNYIKKKIKTKIKIIKRDIYRMISKGKKKFTNFKEHILKKFNKVKKFFKKTLPNNVRKGVNKIKKFFRGIPGSIKGSLNNLIWKFEKAVNKIVYGYNKVAKKVGLSTTRGVYLGRLAFGTSGFGGGWTMVGEKGPELMHLPRRTKVSSNAKSKSMFSHILQKAAKERDDSFKQVMAARLSKKRAEKTTKSNVEIKEVNVNMNGPVTIDSEERVKELATKLQYEIGKQINLELKNL